MFGLVEPYYIIGDNTIWIVRLNKNFKKIWLIKKDKKRKTKHTGASAIQEETLIALSELFLRRKSILTTIESLLIVSVS